MVPLTTKELVVGFDLPLFIIFEDGAPGEAVVELDERDPDPFRLLPPAPVRLMIVKSAV